MWVDTADANFIFSLRYLDKVWRRRFNPVGTASSGYQYSGPTNWPHWGNDLNMGSNGPIGSNGNCEQGAVYVCPTDVCADASSGCRCLEHICGGGTTVSVNDCPAAGCGGEPWGATILETFGRLPCCGNIASCCNNCDCGSCATCGCVGSGADREARLGWCDSDQPGWDDACDRTC
jgi:hypothetical protein